jgi:hypothetical protein
MWENLADPIITGRGEIGQPKLYAEIPGLRAVGASYHCEASWMGFRFLDVRVTERPASTHESNPGPAMQGTLMLKYVPRTGAWGDADICQVSFTPAFTPGLTMESRRGQRHLPSCGMARPADDVSRRQCIGRPASALVARWLDGDDARRQILSGSTDPDVVRPIYQRHGSFHDHRRRRCPSDRDPRVGKHTSVDDLGECATMPPVPSIGPEAGMRTNRLIQHRLLVLDFPGPGR